MRDLERVAFDAMTPSHALRISACGVGCPRLHEKAETTPVDAERPPDAAATIAGPGALPPGTPARQHLSPGARRAGGAGALPASTVQRLQRQMGNRAVARLLAGQRHLARKVDPRVGPAFEAVRRLPRVMSEAAYKDDIVARLKGIDFSDPDNVRAVIREFEATALPPAVIPLVLAALDVTQALPTRERQPTPEEQKEMERQSKLLEVPPRGPYKQSGPGVFIPWASQSVRELVPYVEAIGAGFDGARAFISGSVVGASGPLSAEGGEHMQRRLLQRAVGNAPFPPIVLAGAAAGIV